MIHALRYILLGFLSASIVWLLFTVNGYIVIVAFFCGTMFGFVLDVIGYVVHRVLK